MPDQKKKRFVFDFDDTDDDVESATGALEPFGSNGIHRSAFTGSTFNADQYLTSRRHLGLAGLKTELNGHLRQLKSQLVELINRDYADFVNLSTNLKGLDKVMANLQLPIQDMRSDVTSIRQEMQSVIDALESSLQERAQVREQKASLKLLLNIHESVTKVENLLQINQDGKKRQSTLLAINGELEENGDATNNLDKKQIERVAVEYNQMQHLVSRGKALPFVVENEWRITRIKDTLQSHLSTALANALKEMKSIPTDSTVKASLIQCLRTYALLDQTTSAEQVIRRELIAPALSNIINRQALNAQPTEGSGQFNGNPLSSIYNQIIVFATDKLSPLTDIAGRTLKGAHYEILVDCLWVDIVERINKECSSIFAPGIPDVFHKNYVTTIDFVTKFEALLPSRKSLLYLRNHSSYTEFMRRWQLLVYFQLRFKEIAFPVEDRLKINSFDMPIDIQQNGVNLLTTKAISNAIHQCWSEQIYIYTLSHRFWKMTLQLIRRYDLWATNALANTSTETDKSQQGANTPSRPSTPIDNISVDETRNLRQLLVLAHDVDTLVRETKELFENEISLKLPETMRDEPLMKDSLYLSLQTLVNSVQPEVQRKLTVILSRRCIDVAKNVKSITTQYRHTNKRPPTEPSHYVSNILRPYTIVRDQNKTFIASSREHELITLVAEAVTARYTQNIADMLSSMQKVEESLKKLKKNRKGGAMGSSLLVGSSSSEPSMSDEDKIRLQVYLDVKAYGVQLKNAGLDIESFTPYCNLFDIVKQYESLIS
ncbi:hypothetical protein K450DRAFT_238952 [Umbelopsis ramanniana AG]|uniref:Conserved oligomeric Golgi complex subunit 2 n=1 Tax=Umbelopsis ramanniana AG TaxID=1314678 RepID=A0AAD5ED06_UMBRA|nr:uncharacterized protein K450DRAFT_238952 [Umbelopsis ramanniana AG]KAI8580015.1 hypothetical protein K450DRAFT_238952 [Umbelopsis ramanniana AG]